MFSALLLYAVFFQPITPVIFADDNRFIRQNRERHGYPRRLEILRDDRSFPALLVPDAVNVRDAAAGTLADINEVEHLDERRVSRVGDSAAFRVLNGDTEIAGVREGDNVLF